MRPRALVRVLRPGAWEHPLLVTTPVPAGPGHGKPGELPAETHSRHRQSRGSFSILFCGLEAGPTPPFWGLPHAQIRNYFCSTHLPHLPALSPRPECGSFGRGFLKGPASGDRQPAARHREDSKEASDSEGASKTEKGKQGGGGGGGRGDGGNKSRPAGLGGQRWEKRRRPGAKREAEQQGPQ